MKCPKRIAPGWVASHFRPAYHVFVTSRNKFLLHLYGEREMVRRSFRAAHGWDPNLEMPRTFNEKLAWIKINVRDGLAAQCADKFTVRQYVEDAIGMEYLIPLVGVYRSASDIPFDELPRQFVLKATHGSGCNIICQDKSTFDMSAARRKLRRWLKLNYYYFGYEWAYKDLRPQIICEKLLLDEEARIPKDYKIFCFSGEPRLIQVDFNRFSDHRRNMYDASWRLQPFTYVYPQSEKVTTPPPNLEGMLSIARALAGPFHFVRVDLYTIAARVYFGELTFYPEGGNGRVRPEKYERVIGDMLALK